VRLTKDPNGAAENPYFNPVRLNPPLDSNRNAFDEGDDVATRVLQPTVFEFEIDVPRYQPANELLSRDSFSTTPFLPRATAPG
jgi:hypothetical protein